MSVDGRKTRDKRTYYYKDLTGDKFGHFTVIERAGTNKYGNALWRCLCDCGKVKILPGGKLTSGRSTNCGCKTTEIKAKIASRHGITSGSKPRTFTIWCGMKARCNNPKNASYKNYGARGIKVCNEWLTFENFHNWAIKNGYSDKLQIDRIDNDGDYEPSNCRFVTVKENMRNKRNNHYIDLHGETKTVSEWIDVLGLSKSYSYKCLNESENSFVEYATGKGQVYFINKFLNTEKGEAV